MRYRQIPKGWWCCRYKTCSRAPRSRPVSRAIYAERCPAVARGLAKRRRAIAPASQTWPEPGQSTDQAQPGLGRRSKAPHASPARRHCRSRQADDESGHRSASTTDGPKRLPQSPGRPALQGKPWRSTKNYAPPAFADAARYQPAHRASTGVRLRLPTASSTSSASLSGRTCAPP